jgi:hypothetical protein
MGYVDMKYALDDWSFYILSLWHPHSSILLRASLIRLGSNLNPFFCAKIAVQSCSPMYDGIL